ncbi:hypothetical protein [Alkalinema sp. FACHB-956]|uniref:hypothetical protein n=1 Tax=Alkalinema sp. FACHB-956 TaxID=2692768 RepID=UPI00168963BC|nr:hypothetical protein [Alkalinema sp. FACHB-956]MBD2329643.1 hypothetical protein [Alkalinema sp. FACHB-956]
MLTVILILNGFLATFCFYIAWRVWQFRRVLIQATAALDTAEQATHRVLQDAPEAILQGQISTRQLRQRYRQLEVNLRQAEKALSIVRLGQLLFLGQLKVSQQVSQRLHRSQKFSQH